MPGKTKKATERRRDRATKGQPPTAGSPPPVETIRTIHGADIPAAELQHIAPALRTFAIAIGELKRDPRNARMHGERDLKTTASSLGQFGQQHLLHFATDSKIIKVGNGRHEAAEKILKWKYVAAIPSNLTEAQLKAFGILDNRTAELSEWDRDELDKQLVELSSELADFDVGDIGFTDGELDALAAGDFEKAHGFAPKQDKVKDFAPLDPASQPRLDQRKSVECPHCGKEFIPGAD